MPAKKKKLSKNTDTLILSSIVAIVISLSVYNFAVSLSPVKNNVVYAYSEISQNQSVIEYWNVFLAKYPGYLPGWLDLAKLELENGNISNALFAVNRAKIIDPNSEVVNKILDQIESHQASQ